MSALRTLARTVCHNKSYIISGNEDLFHYLFKKWHDEQRKARTEAYSKNGKK